MYCCYCLVFRSHPILCNPMDYSLPGSSSIEFPMQEYWSGLPFPSAGALPDPGVEPMLLHWQEDSLALNHQGSPNICIHIIVYACVHCIVLLLTFVLYNNKNLAVSGTDTWDTLELLICHTVPGDSWPNSLVCVWNPPRCHLASKASVCCFPRKKIPDVVTNKS